MKRKIFTVLASAIVATIAVMGLKFGGEAAIAQSGQSTKAQTRCILDNLGKAQTDKAVDLLIAVCKKLN